MAVRRERPAWRRVDGVLLLDKAAGVTSNGALQAARRLYRAAKAGHTGTLDPLATGLLPVMFGDATKFGSELLDAEKIYAAEIALGTTTTTGDAEGVVLERRPVALDPGTVDRALERFRGAIEQVPPMYSALKREGRALYEYARAGQTVERAPRPVRIHELRLDAFADARLVVTVRCSKGTYIRVLAEDIGRALGCGAHLAGLRRLATGPFPITEAVTLAALAALSETARESRLLPVDALVGHLPAVTLDAAEARRVAQGQSTRCPDAVAGRVRAYGPGGAFLGVGVVGPDGTLRPRRLLRDAAGAAGGGIPAAKTL